MSTKSTSPPIDTLLPIAAKATLLAAGAVYIMYKYLWVNDDVDDLEGQDDGPHWSEKKSRKEETCLKNENVAASKPKPEFPLEEPLKTEQVDSTGNLIQTSNTALFDNKDGTFTDLSTGIMYDDDGFEISNKIAEATPMKKNRKSIAMHSISEESIIEIMTWFDSLASTQEAQNGQLHFKILSESLMEYPSLARLLLEDKVEECHSTVVSGTTTALDASIIEDALLEITTEHEGIVTRNELLQFLQGRRSISSADNISNSGRKSFLSRFSLSPFNFKRFIYNID